MDIETANQILKLYNLGSSKHSPIKVTGGLIHRMWKAETQKGKFAIKQINSEISARPGVIKNMDLCEEVAQRYHEAGLPTIYALQLNGGFVTQVENIFYLVYPWFESRVFTNNEELNQPSIVKITTILAKIHKINLNIGQKPNSAEIFTPYEIWLDLQTKILLQDNNWVLKCSNFINEIKFWYPKIDEANIHLNANLVFSHCDLDKKNVLWSDLGEPYIIDWESGSYISPIKELVQFALDWSEDGTGKNNPDLIVEIFKTYQLFNQVDFNLLEDAFYSSFGLLEWLRFNINRALTLPENTTEYVNATAEIPKTIDKINLRLNIKDTFLSLMMH